MGFLDLFKPKWKNSDAEVRADAVRQLGHDDARILAEVVRRDGDSKVRRIAIKKISDPALLSEVAMGDPDEALREAAAEKMGELLIAAAVADLDEAASLNALGRIELPRQIAHVARKASLATVRDAALERLTDAAAIGDVARNAPDARTRKAAVARSSDAAVLRAVAINDASDEVALAAVARLEDAAALDQVIKKAKPKSVRNAAKARLAQVAPDRPAAAPKAAAQRKAVQRQLCARAEAAAVHKDLDEASAEMEAVRAAWDELGHEAGDDELRLRFGRAADKFEARRNEKKKDDAPAAATAAAAAAKPGRSAKPAAAAEAARERAERQKRDDAQAADDARQHEEARKQEEAARAARVAEERARKDAERVANAERMVALCERLERAHDLADRKTLDQTLKDAQAALETIGPLPRGDEEGLRDRYDKARRVLAIHLQEMRDAEDWKRWANVPRLEALCVKVEAMAAGTDADARETAAQLKALQAEWKAAGPVPRDKNEILWGRFKKAADEVYARIKGQLAALDEERDGNLKKKEELAARVEALAAVDDATINWKETAETVKLLQAEWKAIGPTQRAAGDAVWKKFRAACDRFFERRQAHFEVLDGARAANLTALEALCAKVEALADQATARAAEARFDWKATADLIKQYQADWKETGPAPKEHADAIWNRFRAACDRFFDLRKSHFAALDEERGGNLKKKELLCEKVEALAGADDESVLELVRGFQAEWKTIGPAPRDQADAVWERFRTACDRVYDKQRRGPDVEAPPAAEGGEAPSGLSGFTNKLPLGDVLAKLQQQAGHSEPADKAPVDADPAADRKPGDG